MSPSAWNRPKDAGRDRATESGALLKAPGVDAQPLVLRAQLNARYLLGCVAVFAFSALVFRMGVDGRAAADNGISFPGLLLVGSFAAAVRLRIVEQIGEEFHVLRATEVPLLIGLFTQRPAVVVGTAALGSLIGALLERRIDPPRQIATVAFTIFEVTTVCALFFALVSDTWVLFTNTWAVAFGVTIAVHMFRTTLELALAAFAGSDIPGRQAFGTLVLNFLASVSMASLGIVSVIVATQSRAASMLVVALIAMPMAVYRAYVLVRDRFVRVRQLQEFTSVVSRSSDRTQLYRDLATAARRVLLSEHAELVLVAPSHLADEAEGGVVRETSSVGSVLPGPERGDFLWERAVSTRRVVRAHRTGGDDRLVAYLKERNIGSLLAAPMFHGEDVLGLLVVIERRADLPSFSTSDAEVLTTMADHAAAIVHVRQLDEQVRAEAAERARVAAIDALTGLPNRVTFQQRVDAIASEVPADASTSAAVLTLDLNRFKDINATLGHGVGDALVRGIGERIRAVIPASATVARLGGDEFAVVLPDVPSAASAVAAAELIAEAVRTELVIGDVTIVTDCALGIALIPDHGRDHLALMRRADVAMYSAKEHREGAIEVFDLAQEQASERQTTLVAALRDAIETKALKVHYQPKGRLDDGMILGAEALVRWQHPEHGFIPPDEFIRIAEHSGLIGPLTDLVLEAALAQCRVWHDKGLGVSVAVNLSARSLRDLGLATRVATLLALLDLPASALTLEITEGEFVQDAPLAQRVIRDLHTLGVHLSIDDFGTGYSSLSYLARLTADEVKIDKSFVTHVADDDVSAAIVRAVVELAQQLGLRTVAEGVEDQRTWDRLRELGVDIAQGYFLSRPVPGETLGMWLWERRRSGVGQVASVEIPSNVRELKRR